MLRLVPIAFLAACQPLIQEEVDSTPPDASDTDPASDTLSPPTEPDTTAPADGCAGTGWTTGAYTLDHRGVERHFRVYVPATYVPDEPAPLIVAFHGWGGGDREFVEDATVTAEADARGYVVIAPQGLGPGSPDDANASWSFAGSTTGRDGDGLNGSVAGDSTDICDEAATPDYRYASCDGVAQNGCAWTHCQDDDVAFVVALVAEARQNLCIDGSRVYAAGGSNGGMFTWELGQNAASAGTFRAIAPLIGLPHRGFLAPPGRPGGMPALLVTGLRDRTVPPGAWDDPSFTTTSDGDVFYYTGATAITQVWAQAAGCSVNGPATPLDVGVPGLDCRSHCAANGALPPVVDCRADMGHTYALRTTWPLVMSFFEQHR